jgi:exodeoxyribonuclease VII large subunit
MAVLSVSELNRYVRLLLDQDPFLQQVAVVGEVANFKAHTSGHLYFTLRDAEASVRAVMFRSRAERLRFRPENGQSVIALGRVSVFERDGAYQLYVDDLEPAGLGSQYLGLMQLKAKLEAEGVFARPKRPLPLLPRVVGVVTAERGAAFRDIVTVARRRNPGQAILLSPALVQGPSAPASLVSALEALYRHPRVDVIIIGRGGGAHEDLSAFNDEAVVRAVARSPVPIVSAVGHEIDVTLVDFAADERAPTPSAAAERVVPRRADLEALVAERARRATRAVVGRIDAGRRRLGAVLDRRPFRRPVEVIVHLRRERVDRLKERMASRFARRVADGRARLAALAGRLDALSPLAVLARGYAILASEGKVVRGVRDLRPGQEVAGRLIDGAFTAQVAAVQTEPAGGGMERP